MELPSKELMEAVIGTKIIHVEWLCDDVSYYIHENYHHELDIYYLMHLMKEWAKKEGYELHSGYNGPIDVYECVISEMYEEDGVRCESSYREELGNSTEFEVVSDSCEWILKESNEQA